MKKLKLIFNQTLMISTAILFGIGIQSLLLHFTQGTEVLRWQWYIPLSIVLTGFVCSLPTRFFLSIDHLSKGMLYLRIAIHFVSIGGIVSLCGYLFRWYESLQAYLPILAMYVVIYCFVWIATAWMVKLDEKKINDAIKDLQDEE